MIQPRGSGLRFAPPILRLLQPPKSRLNLNPPDEPNTPVTHAAKCLKLPDAGRLMEKIMHLKPLVTIAFWLSTCTIVSASEQGLVRGVIYEQQSSPPHAYGSFTFDGVLNISSNIGHFTLRDDVTSSKYNHLSCNAYYPIRNTKTITTLLTCSYGRNGNLILTFDNTRKSSGRGTFILSDGSSGFIIFGMDVYRNNAL